ANLNIINAHNLKYLFYHYGINPIISNFVNGKKAWIKKLN
ncbi:unnamed protein product, partial [marine sediment metagenome]